METAERCLQTTQVMAHGLFPNGTGPPGFPDQPVAVQTEQASTRSGQRLTAELTADPMTHCCSDDIAKLPGSPGEHPIIFGLPFLTYVH